MAIFETKSGIRYRASNDEEATARAQELEQEESDNPGTTRVSRTNQYTNEYMNSLNDEETRLSNILDESLYEEPDRNEILSKRREEAQGLIDTITSQFNQTIAQEEQRGEVRNARTRALNVSSGLSGSDFGSAAAQETEDQNAQAIALIKKERDAKINEILSGVSSRADEEYRSQRESFLQRVEGRLDTISNLKDELRTRATNDVKSIASLGIGFDEFKQSHESEYSQLLEDSGLTELGLKALFFENTPQDQVIDTKQIGNQYINFIQDPVTGKIRTEALDLPEGVTLGSGRNVKTTSAGDILVYPDEFDPNRPIQDQIQVIKGRLTTEPTSNEENSADFDTAREIAAGEGTREQKLNQIRSQTGLSLGDANNVLDEVEQQNAPKNMEEFEAQFTETVRGLKDFGIEKKSDARDELEAQMRDQLGLSASADIPPQYKDALDNSLDEVYGSSSLKSFFFGN